MVRTRALRLGFAELFHTVATTAPDADRLLSSQLIRSLDPDMVAQYLPPIIKESFDRLSIADKQKCIEHVLRSPDAKEVLATHTDQVQEILNTSNDLRVEECHLANLKKDLCPEKHRERLNALTWRVLPYPRGSLIIGDFGPMQQVTGSPE